MLRRELRAFRLERALTTTLRAAQDYRRQLDTVLQRSNDAIAQVQEGIVVDANPAWLELFGFDDADAVVGQPVMDLFDAESHAALKGALAACQQGRWSDHTLRRGRAPRRRLGAAARADACRRRVRGRARVRLIVPARRRDEQQLEADSARRCAPMPSTGLLHAALPARASCRRALATPMRGGVRFLACIRPDRFRDIERPGRHPRRRGIPRAVRRAGALAARAERSRRPLRRHQPAGADRARQRARRRGLGRERDRTRGAPSLPVSATSRRSRPHDRARPRAASEPGPRRRRPSMRSTPRVAGASAAATRSSRSTAPTTTRACRPTTRSG